MTEIQDKLNNNNNNKSWAITSSLKKDRNRKSEERRSGKELAELWRVKWGSTWGVGGKLRVSILGTGSSMCKGMKPQSTEARLENWGLLVVGNGSNELSKQEAKQ